MAQGLQVSLCALRYPAQCLEQPAGRRQRGREPGTGQTLSRRRVAVQGLDLSVRRGEVYGFLGTQPQSPENPEPAVGALQAIGVLLVYLALFLALSGLALRRR